MTIRIDGPTIATQVIHAMPLAFDRIMIPDYAGAPTLGQSVYYGSTFDHVVGPTVPIVGVARDKDTGEPLARVTLQGRSVGGSGLIQRVETKTDADGRYRLTGLSLGRENRILAIPPDDQPYLLSELRVRDSSGLKETTLDFGLKRGVWITGRVTNRANGKVPKSAVFYFVDTGNPNYADAPGLPLT